MTDKERFKAIMGFEKPDRILYWEQGFWGGAIERWYKEGMERQYGVTGNPAYGDTVRGPATPSMAGDSVCQDVVVGAGLDTPARRVPVNMLFCPAFEEKTLEESEDQLVVQDALGIIKRIPKEHNSIPHFMSWPVTDEKSFEALAEERLDPNHPDRIPSDWDKQVESLNSYDGVVAIGGYPCGFFGTPRFLMGEIEFLIAFLDNPKLVKRIITHLADLWSEMYDKVLGKVHADCIHIWEDMSFKNGPLISPALFQEFLVPAYKKVTDTAKAHGVDVVLVDTDGDCTSLIPHFLDGGVTGLYPFEVQAGMDVNVIRDEFPTLQILGGINKRELAGGRERIDTEVERILPHMLEKGGFIPMADHQVPPDVSWEDYRYYRSRVAELSV